MPKDISSNTGTAQIMKQGHTTAGVNGDNPKVQAQFGQRNVTEIKPKA